MCCMFIYYFTIHNITVAYLWLYCFTLRILYILGSCDQFANSEHAHSYSWKLNHSSDERKPLSAQEGPCNEVKLCYNSCVLARSWLYSGAINIYLVSTINEYYLTWRYLWYFAFFRGYISHGKDAITIPPTR